VYVCAPFYRGSKNITILRHHLYKNYTVFGNKQVIDMSDINSTGEFHVGPSYFADGKVVPDLMTIDEVVVFLRIPEVSTAKDYHNVVKNLIRYRDLPHIRISNRLLFPRQAVLEWIGSETIRN